LPNANPLPPQANPELLPAESAVGIPISENIGSLSIGDIGSPAIITANAVPSDSPPFPLNHARILYANLLIGSTVAASVGSDESDTLIPNTADRWTFTASGGDDTITFTLSANDDFDTICIGSHNLGDLGATVTAQYDDDETGTFTDFTAAKNPLNNTSIMFHIGTAVDARRIRIKISGASGAGYIGSIYAGIALQMQRPFFSGHSPINLSAVTDYYSSRTESGNFIGREIRSREFQTSVDWSNLDDLWYRTYFQPFVISAKTLPFYFAWNLLEHPDDVGYCMTNDDIKPSYIGIRDLLAVGFDLVGLA
jgi:hypothetical protein